MQQGDQALAVLYLDQINTGFDQVGGIAVAQAVRCDLFLGRRPCSPRAGSFARHRDPAVRWRLRPRSNRHGDWGTTAEFQVLKMQSVVALERGSGQSFHLEVTSWFVIKRPLVGGDEAPLWNPFRHAASSA